MDRRLRLLLRELPPDPPDEALTRVLIARIRAGDARARCAWYLGHAPLIDALGDHDPPTPTEPGELVLGLKPFGPAAFLRAAAALTSFFLPPIADMVFVIDGWLACPCAAHASRLRDAARRAQLGAWEPEHVGPVAMLARLAIPPVAPRRRDWYHERRPHREGPQPVPEYWLCRPTGTARGRRLPTSARSEQEVWATIVAAVLPWALDPGS